MRVQCGFVILVMVCLTLGGCSTPAETLCLSCAEAKINTGWCDDCNIGYVAGVPVTSKMLFSAAHVHGHEADPQALHCDFCRAAMKTGGFCEKCQTGWSGGQAYFSALPYVIAKGNPKNPIDIACPVCRKNSARYGWCTSCQRGMIGNIAVTNRGDYDRATSAMDRLFAALPLQDQCETCATAALTNGRCTKCRINYKDGQPVSQ